MSTYASDNTTSLRYLFSYFNRSAFNRDIYVKLIGSGGGGGGTSSTFTGGGGCAGAYYEGV